jgi:hypothetical protein
VSLLVQFAGQMASDEAAAASNENAIHDVFTF